MTTLYETLRQAAVAVGRTYNSLEIHRNRRGEKKEYRKTVFQLRDTLIYRFDAVSFHLALLEQLHLDAEVTLSERSVSQRDRGFLKQAATHQRFLFDDIVFNAMAFLDYLARYIGCVQQDPHNAKLRWNRAHKLSKHSAVSGRVKNNLYSSFVGAAIVKADEGWVRRFSSYRSGLIHDHSDEIDGNFVTTWTRNTGNELTPSHELSIEVPKGFVKALRLVDVGGEPVDIPRGAGLLVEKICNTAVVILQALEKDVQTELQRVRDSGAA